MNLIFPNWYNLQTSNAILYYCYHFNVPRPTDLVSLFQTVTGRLLTVNLAVSGRLVTGAQWSRLSDCRGPVWHTDRVTPAVSYTQTPHTPRSHTHMQTTGLVILALKVNTLAGTIPATIFCSPTKWEHRTFLPTYLRPGRTKRSIFTEKKRHLRFINIVIYGCTKLPEYESYKS